MDFKIFDRFPADWDDFVKDHSNGRLYHLSQWNELIKSTFRHSIKYIVLENSNKIEGILPLTEIKSLLFGKFSVSLPFINYGGVLVRHSRYYSEFFNYLRKYLERSDFDFVELRMDSFMETSLPCKEHKVTFLMELPQNPEELLSTFKAKVRNQIRRPTKEGMYGVSGSEEILDDFYKVYSVNMRDLGTPALPKVFFRNILQTFPDNAFVISIYSKEEKPVAACFLIQYDGICEIPWASSLKKYNRFSPNMLLYWESFKLAIQNDCRLFDFGRCTPGSGTYRFKRQWGANEKQLYWYYVLRSGEALPEINPNNPKYNLAINIWRKLPVSLVNVIGPSIIRNIP